jgi:hypothetical protein
LLDSALSTSLTAYYRLAATWLASGEQGFSSHQELSVSSLAKVLFLAESPPDFCIPFQSFAQPVADFSAYQAALFAVSSQDYRLLLGQCRLWLPRVAFFTQQGISPLDLTAALAMGFEKVYQWSWQGRELSLYLFQLYDYKTLPDWLNSRYWANPDLFDKFYW